MRRYGPQLFFFLLVSIAALGLACGSSQPRTLQSVSLSPATADANGSPVQFTATGFYNTSPSQVTPFTATWGVCTVDSAATTEITVSSTGLARCATGASGTFAVWGYGSNLPMGVNCSIVTACGGGCGSIGGMAKITCP
jgi:hypothetical protein